MELYNTIIRGVEGLAALRTRRFAYDPADAWEPGSFELVMLRDAAFELGGGSKPAVNFTCVTTSPLWFRRMRSLSAAPIWAS